MERMVGLGDDDDDDDDDAAAAAREGFFGVEIGLDVVEDGDEGEELEEEGEGEEGSGSDLLVVRGEEATRSAD